MYTISHYLEMPDVHWLKVYFSYFQSDVVFLSRRQRISVRVCDKFVEGKVAETYFDLFFARC